jgi:hypothetical protein
MTIRGQISTTKIKLSKSIHLSTCYQKLIVENEFGLTLFNDQKSVYFFKNYHI